MKNFLSIIFIFIIFIFSNIAHSNDKIVFLNIEKIISTSKAGSSMLNEINDIEKKNFESFKTTEKELKEIEKNILAQKNILSEVEFNNKVLVLKKDINKYKNDREKKKNDLRQLRMGTTNKFLKSINEILVKYANENSISLILQKKNLVMGKNELDITNKIIIIVNKEIKNVKIK